ncbi:peroxidase 64-like [Lolium perenne]|uniref:peroxidase 64-like n=1 Tax=Lolium perenne TaxID=4522 RepID=UPI003A993018
MTQSVETPIESGPRQRRAANQDRGAVRAGKRRRRPQRRWAADQIVELCVPASDDGDLEGAGQPIRSWSSCSAAVGCKTNDPQSSTSLCSSKLLSQRISFLVGWEDWKGSGFGLVSGGEVIWRWAGFRQRQGGLRRVPLPGRRVVLCWAVPLGRGDGRVSLTTSLLPGPGATFDQLKQAFHAVGLSAKDLVVLSGGHTLGFAHCSSFETRIRGFPGGGGGAGVADPALRPSFAAALRRACPANNTAKGAGAWMDPTSAAFDNAYFKMLQTGHGLLASDEALLTHPKTRRMVALYAASQGKFFQAFVSSMLRMSAQNQPGEIRANCRRHN